MAAEVVLHGNDTPQSRRRAEETAQERRLTYINGYADPAIIAGQGTLGLEVAAQVPNLDAIIVPVGGGGLIAGAALALKTLKPSVKIVGVEPENASSFHVALAASRPVPISMKPTLADGLAVAQVGEN